MRKKVKARIIAKKANGDKANTCSIAILRNTPAHRNLNAMANSVYGLVSSLFNIAIPVQRLFSLTSAIVATNSGAKACITLVKEKKISIETNRVCINNFSFLLNLYHE